MFVQSWNNFNSKWKGPMAYHQVDVTPCQGQMRAQISSSQPKCASHTNSAIATVSASLLSHRDANPKCHSSPRNWGVREGDRKFWTDLSHPEHFIITVWRIHFSQRRNSSVKNMTGLIPETFLLAKQDKSATATSWQHFNPLQRNL